MKPQKILLIIAVLAGLMTFIPSCKEYASEKPDNDKPYELPNFKNASEKLIKNNLEFPSGLSSNTGSKKSELKSAKGINGGLDGVFIEAPLFVNNRNPKGIEPYQNPIISQFYGDLQNLFTTPLTEIDITEYPTDFDSPSDFPVYSASGDSLWRAKGLTLDCLALPDGTILFSSNSSDKIFQRNLSGEIGIFLQDNNLKRITDIIEGRDSKIYAAQVPLIDDNDSSKIISPKRVISIDEGVINTEFELPSDVNTHFWYNLGPRAPYWWREAPLFEKLKVIENSDAGKENFGVEFYVADALEDVIYKVDAQKNVSILAKGLRYPSALAVDSAGNIFYTTHPLSNGNGGWDVLTYRSALCVLNPETGESTLLYEFNESLNDYASEGGWAFMKYNNKVYTMPAGHNNTLVLSESKSKLEFLITNSLQGTLKYVSIEK